MDLERASDPASQGLCLTRLLPSPTLQEAGSRQKEGRTAGSCWPRLFLPLRKGKPILEAASRSLLLHSMGQNGVLWLPSYKGEGTVSCGLCSGRQRGGRGGDRAPGGPIHSVCLRAHPGFPGGGTWDTVVDSALCVTQSIGFPTPYF